MPPSKFFNAMDILQTGFNRVATNPILIAIPILFDLLIWLGPRIGIYEVLANPLANFTNGLLRELPFALRTQYQVVFKTIINGLRDSNLFGAMTFLPGSVPFLFSGNLPATSPLPVVQYFKLTNTVQLILLTVTLMIFGFLAGNLYLAMIAQCASSFGFKLTPKRFFEQVKQMTILVLVIALIGVVASFPLSFIFLMASSFIRIPISILVMVLLLLFIWILFPLVFVPAGILSGQTLQQSAKLSRQLTRAFRQPISNLILIALVIERGLELIWRIPAADSWISLIGIFGFAFINTAVISSYMTLYYNLITLPTITKQMILSKKQGQQEE